MKIDGNTNIFTLIGNNISHSYSPVIHNFLFKFFNINAVYIPFELKNINSLENFFNFFKNTVNFKGANITIPYKEKAFFLSDKILDEKAKEIKAINCIKKDSSGNIIAVNTDSAGFLKSLNITFDNKKVVIIGSGSTARTIIYSIVNNVDEILILSRKNEKIKDILEKYKNVTWKYFKNSEEFLKFDNFHLIINATPLGLNGELLEVNFKSLRKNCHIFEVLYVDTPLSKKAKKYGIDYTSGVNMLIYQAVKSFEFWTNIKVEDKIINILKDEVFYEKKF